MLKLIGDDKREAVAASPLIRLRRLDSLGLRFLKKAN